MLSDLLAQDEIFNVAVHRVRVGNSLDDRVGGVGYGKGGGVEGD